MNVRVNMNLFYKLYARTYQKIFKLMIPILPYKNPKIIEKMEDITSILIEKQKKNPIIITDEGIVKLGLLDVLIESLDKNNIPYTIFKDVIPNPTTEVVAKALEEFKNKKCDSIIAFGGGSAMDTAKAVGALVAKPKKTLAQLGGILKVRKKIPLLIALPTTCGTGSETTLASVITDSQTRHKYAINDFPLIPSYAVLDYRVILGLPRFLVATTGLDAMTHAIEAYIGKSTTKDTRTDALEAIKLIFENIESATYSHDTKALQNMLIASHKAGRAFSKSYVGYVHAIAHSLGGKYNIAHGYANAVILPYVLEEYGDKIYKKLAKIVDYVGFGNPNMTNEEKAKLFMNKLNELESILKIDKTINVIKEEDIEQMAHYAVKEANPLYPVPVLWDKKKMIKMYYKIKGVKEC